MKKVVLGSTMFLAGTIAVALLLAAALIVDWRVTNYRPMQYISTCGLAPVFFSFIGISIVGIIVAIWGLHEKKLTISVYWRNRFMKLNDYPYLIIPEAAQSMKKNVKQLLCCNGKHKTYEHVCNVAEENVKIAKAYGLNIDKCFMAGLLHDISAVIKPGDMLLYIKSQHQILCEAEERFPFLLHQRISGILSKEYFDVDDRDVLSAITCHTTLKANASQYDMALFIADKLAWDQEGIPPFYDDVENALKISLEKACFVYMTYMNENNKILFPHTDWNAGYKWIETELI